MEHRWHRRREVDWDVFIDLPAEGMVRVRTKNVSAGGLLVDVGPRRLVCGRVVALVCVAPCGGPLERLHRLRALVVHAAAGQAGLMLIGAGGAGDAAWRAALSARPGAGGFRVGLPPVRSARR